MIENFTSESLLHHAMSSLKSSNEIATNRVLSNLLDIVVLDLDALGLASSASRRVGAIHRNIEIAKEVGHVAVLDVEVVEQRVLGGLYGLEDLVVLGLERLEPHVELLEPLLHLVADERLRVHLAHLVALVRLERELAVDREYERVEVQVALLIRVRVQVPYAPAYVVYCLLTRSFDVLLRR